MSKALLAGTVLTLLPVAIFTEPATAHGPVPERAAPSSAPQHETQQPQQTQQQPRGPRRSAAPDSGLAVTLREISPATLQPGERLQVRGTIENLDRKRRVNLKVYLVRPAAVATTTEQVADMADTPARHPDGERITRAGLYPEIGGLAPGATKPFHLNIPFRQLGLSRTAYGVYTLGVHVLADDVRGGRDTTADGRARSLIPLMPKRSPLVPTSTIWPFRTDIVREPDGEYPDRDELIDDVAPGGRLRTQLDLARTAGSTPISVLVDPALLDTLRRIVNNTIGRPEAPSSPTESPTSTEEGAFEALAASTTDADAAAFLDDLTTLAREQSLLAVGYGGPDLTALSDYDASRLYRTLDRANDSTLSPLDLSASRAYLPTGVLDVEALADLGPRTTPLVSADQVRRWNPYDGPIGTVRAPDSRARVVVTDDEVFEGGPAPGPTDTALQVRQRLLAETAAQSLEARDRGRRRAPGLVLMTDDGWDPGPNARSADFFSAFDAPWVLGTDLDSQLDEDPRRGARKLRARQHVPGPEEPPIPNSLASTADKIRGRGVIMYAITREDERLLTYYDQAAALTISEQWRLDPEASQELADDNVAQLDQQLSGITVEAPEFVTLSSSSGRFPLTITNDLPWPIRVGVQLSAEDGGLEIQQDELIDVDPQQSTTVNVSVEAEDVAVSEVTARLTTPKGRPFGDPVTFKMRSSVVGTVIWIALGAAGVFMVLAVGRRIWRSTRSSRRADDTAAAGGPAGSEAG